MKSSLVAFVTASAAAAAAPPPAVARPEIVWFGARLSGAFVPTGGDSDGDGSLLIELDTARNRMCYTLMARRIGLSRSARLHPGDPAERKDEAFSLDVTGPRNTTCTPVSQTMVAEIISRPEKFVVTVRNNQFPDGALRGQLRKR